MGDWVSPILRVRFGGHLGITLDRSLSKVRFGDHVLSVLAVPTNHCAIQEYILYIFRATDHA